MSTKAALILHFSIPMSKTPDHFFPKYIKNHYFIVSFVMAFNSNIYCFLALLETLTVCDRFSIHKEGMTMFLSIYTCNLVGQKPLASELVHEFPTWRDIYVMSTTY